MVVVFLDLFQGNGRLVAKLANHAFRFLAGPEGSDETPGDWLGRTRLTHVSSNGTEQFFKIDGLGNVVVAAGFQAFLAFLG